MILLKTVPYDPLSIFRGTYAALRYEISSLPASLLQDVRPKDLKNGDELFVLLIKENGDTWQAKAIYKREPKDDGNIYLRGRLKYYYGYYQGEEERKLDLEYGIESFFLSEDSAKAVDGVNLGSPVDWRERDRKRKERLDQLDEETKRINKAGLTEWWLKKLDTETEVWVKEGTITQDAKGSIHDKYVKALEKIKAIDEDLSPQRLSSQKPIIVEVAVDSNSFGHPTRLFVEGKEYK
jgi:uncharacterized membrane-anchored protein